MATILHSAIADADRHEPKGASTARAKQFLSSNGDGTTLFREVNYDDLGVKPTSAGYILSISNSDSSASQTPASTNTALQVLFGAAKTSTDVSISSDGEINFTNGGQYIIRYGLSFSGGTSGAVIFFRVLSNGNPLEPTHRMQLAAGEISEFCETFMINAASGDVLTIEISSDSSGAGIGGLSQAAPNTTGWSSAPTAEISIYKFQGIQ